jgi:hypothetical protein
MERGCGSSSVFIDMYDYIIYQSSPVLLLLPPPPPLYDLLVFHIHLVQFRIKPCSPGNERNCRSDNESHF